MKLTTKGRYAVTALLDLAYQGHDAVVSLSDISERQSISISYLEQLFSKLRKKGLVTSIRGATGGYKMAKSVDDITVLDIIDAVDESVNATRCHGQANCQGGQMCLTHDLWLGLSEQIENYLREINLSSLLRKENVQRVAIRQAKDTDVFDKTLETAVTDTDKINTHDMNDDLKENAEANAKAVANKSAVSVL